MAGGEREERDLLAALRIRLALLWLTGIPPLPGFVAKFLIFKHVIAAGCTLYPVLGLAGSIAAAVPEAVAPAARRQSPAPQRRPAARIAEDVGDPD